MVAVVIVRHRNVEVDEKGTATFTARSRPGTYPYHGTHHPTMHGQLVGG